SRCVSARDDHRILEDTRTIAPASAHDRRPRVLRDVEPRRISALRLGVHNVGIVGIDGRVETVAPADVVPVAVRDTGAILSARRPTPGSVILQSAAHGVRLLHAVTHGVELTDREGIYEIVRAPAII